MISADVKADVKQQEIKELGLLNGQNPLSVTKVIWWRSLNVTNSNSKCYCYSKYLTLSYDWFAFLKSFTKT